MNEKPERAIKQTRQETKAEKQRHHQGRKGHQPRRIQQVFEQADLAHNRDKSQETNKALLWKARPKPNRQPKKRTKVKRPRKTRAEKPQ